MSVDKPQLPIPAPVDSAGKAMEMARIWLADSEQCVVLTPHLWKDPASWGLMLVDLARHVASAYEAQGHDRDEVLNKIRAAFDAEWSHPTDDEDA